MKFRKTCFRGRNGSIVATNAREGREASKKSLLLRRDDQP
jgi:hypothetical protein